LVNEVKLILGQAGSKLTTQAAFFFFPKAGARTILCNLTLPDETEDVCRSAKAPQLGSIAGNS
jgi:hypothetical protein